MNKNRDVLLSLLLLFVGSSCLTSPEIASLNKGTYAIDAGVISQINFTRQFPGETPWTVRLKKVGSASSIKQWLIEGAPRPLVDHLADAVFVLHLISTFNTVQAIETPEKDMPERFGLNPQRARIEWFQPGKSFVLMVGDEKSPGVRYGRFKEDAGTQVFSGAVLRMLEVPQTWEGLRQSRLFLRPIDDFDIIAIESPQGSATYERLGVNWEKKKGQGPKATELPALFERLFHFRIKKFIDDSHLQSGLQIATTQPPQYTLRLTDRANAVTIFQFATIKEGSEENTLVRSSERDENVFETYPEVLSLFRELTHAGVTPPKSSKKK